MLAAFLLPCVLAPFAITQAVVLWLSRRYPPLGEFHEIGGIRLHVVDRPAKAPDAPTLVWVHGASGNARDPLGALDTALDGRYRFIAIDRPGHGHSAAGDRASSDPRRQADLFAGLLDRIGVGRAIVVGHSWGGAVAAAFALQHPDKTAGLVFVAPATHPWTGGVGWRYRLSSRPIVDWLFSHMAAVPVGLFMVDCALRKVFRPDPVPHGYRATIGAAQALRPLAFRVNNRDVADFYDNIVPLSRDYSLIQAPTAIVTGDTDQIVSPTIHAHALARDILGARLTVIAGGGHMPHWSATPTVVAAIDDVAQRAAAAACPEAAPQLAAE